MDRRTSAPSINPALPLGPGWNAILFDLDGTLADTIEIILSSYRHTMRVHLGRELPDQEWLATIGTPLKDQLRGFARSEEETRAMMATYQAYQLQIHDAMVRPYPGVRGVIRHLSATTPLALVTSKRRDMALRTVRGCGLDGCFTAVVTADDVAIGKPDPESVKAALKELGSPVPETALFVGDSPFDVTAGHRAGVRTAAALWGAFPRDALEASGPDYILTRIEDVLSLPRPAGHEELNPQGSAGDPE